MAFLSAYFAVICADELFSLWEREGEEYLHLLSYFSLPIINENKKMVKDQAHIIVASLISFWFKIFQTSLQLIIIFLTIIWDKGK